jgi:hypothetical protein
MITRRSRHDRDFPESTDNIVAMSMRTGPRGTKAPGQTSLGELRAKLILSQPERANPGIWPTMFNRGAKTGKGLASNAQAVDVLTNPPVTHLGRQATVCDVAASSMRELIRLFNELIAEFEESQNILNSAPYIVKVMATGYPMRYVVEHRIDEF